MPPSRTFALSAAAFLWIAAVGGGLIALGRYSATAGDARPPEDAASAFLAAHRKPERALLVMAVHPRCPCTDASLAELGDLLARSEGRCDAVLLEWRPADEEHRWPASAGATRLGGVAVRRAPDPGGAIAAALGAETSGHVVFLDARGAMQFHGGITPGRGHRGRSVGQDAILQILDARAAAADTSPVFGCALRPGCGPVSIQ